MDAPAYIIIKGITRQLYNTIIESFTSGEIIAHWLISFNLYSVQLDYCDLRFDGVSGNLRILSNVNHKARLEITPFDYVEIVISA